MEAFAYREGRLLAERVPLGELAARFGTPCYVYSRAALEAAWRAFDQGLDGHPHLICYAVKANANLAVLNCLARLGSGFDIVSQGELERVLCAGGDPKRVVFSGVGKREEELRRALELGIHGFHIESEGELLRLQEVAARLGRSAPFAIRVNPGVDAGTHPYIATGTDAHKFGVPIDEALALYRKARSLPYLEPKGLACHIGSQLTSLAGVLSALGHLLVLAEALEAEGMGLEYLDLGGGLGVRYRDETPPEPQDYARTMVEGLGGRDHFLIVEPGRAIAGPAGVLLTRVEYLKTVGARRFAIVDAAMNDLLRPALYGAWQEIVPVEIGPGSDRRPAESYEVVGPVCESADFLGRDRPLCVAVGDLLAVRTAGAYGFSMSSNYNSRPRAAEVLVDGDQAYLVRRREAIADLMAGEALAPIA